MDPESIAEDIEKYRRLVKGEKPLLVDTILESATPDALNLTNPESNVKVKLCDYKAEYKQLKRQLISEQTKYTLLRSIAGAEEEISQQKVDEELKATCQKLSNDKETLQDIKTSIEEQGDKIESDYALLQNCICECDDFIKSLTEKNAEIEEKLKIHTNLLGKHEERLAAKKARLDLDSASRELYTRLEYECSEMRKAVAELRRQGKELDAFIQEHKEKAKLNKDANRKVEWSQKLLGIQEVCHDVRIKQTTPESIVVECLRRSGEDGSNLEITCRFSTDKEENISYLQSVTINVTDLAVDEIIQTAVEKNDASIAVLEIQRMWQQQYPLLREMDSLREKYALDWMRDSSTVKVLFGRKASVVCSLSLPESYPSRGNVTLLSTEGLPEDFDTAQLQNCTEPQKLSSWLEHLHDLLKDL